MNAILSWPQKCLRCLQSDDIIGKNAVISAFPPLLGFKKNTAAPTNTSQVASIKYLKMWTHKSIWKCELIGVRTIAPNNGTSLKQTPLCVGNMEVSAFQGLQVVVSTTRWAQQVCIFGPFRCHVRLRKISTMSDNVNIHCPAFEFSECDAQIYKSGRQASTLRI